MALSGDEQRTIFSQLCNVLDPGFAVAFSSASSERRTATQAPRQQLRADYEAATALGRKAGRRSWSCKGLREANRVECVAPRLARLAERRAFRRGGAATGSSCHGKLDEPGYVDM